jgi:hypothetical protein
LFYKWKHAAPAQALSSSIRVFVCNLNRAFYLWVIDAKSARPNSRPHSTATLHKKQHSGFRVEV